MATMSLKINLEYGAIKVGPPKKKKNCNGGTTIIVCDLPNFLRQDGNTSDEDGVIPKVLQTN
jgi:hypothetical protein